MKKHLLFFFSLVISVASFAQNNSYNQRSYNQKSYNQKSFNQIKPTFGVKAGLSETGIRGDASTNFNNLLSNTNGILTTQDQTGFFAGAFVNLPVGDVLSLEPGIYYSQKGYQLHGALDIKGLGFLGANAKASLKLEYVDIPVLLKMNFNGLQLFAGPQFSYLAHGNLKTTASVLGLNLLNNNSDVTADFSKWDVGITGGIGYKFAGGFNISASYDYGLSKIDANQNVNAYNRGIKVGVGISL
ncbi:MAG: PorT family protein [Chitinophagaceae bacterium]|nr:PorT family protein [Chitinophagaceae bacterium]